MQSPSRELCLLLGATEPHSHSREKDCKQSIENCEIILPYNSANVNTYDGKVFFFFFFRNVTPESFGNLQIRY